MEKWIYIVSWTLVSVTFGNCPQPNTEVDEFNRKVYPNKCYDSYVETSKTFIDQGFNSRKKAFKFYHKALENKETLVPSKLKSKDYIIFVEIDSTRNKKYKRRKR